jgi:hypothetical protein
VLDITNPQTANIVGGGWTVTQVSSTPDLNTGVLEKVYSLTKTGTAAPVSMNLKLARFRIKWDI